MSNLKYWQNKIKEKRKDTDFRDFLKEIASWVPLNLHKKSWWLSRYPDTERIKNVVSEKEFYEQNDTFIKKGLKYDFDLNFFQNYFKLRNSLPNLWHMCT